MAQTDSSFNAKYVVSEELNRLCGKRIGEIWLYCAVLLAALSYGGYKVLGTTEIIIPLAAVCISGAITGTLYAWSQARTAYRELELVFELSEADHRSPEEILRQIREMRAYPASAIALHRSIFR
jgi:hypothetical protein